MNMQPNAEKFLPKIYIVHFFGHLFVVFLMNYELIEDSIQYINQVFLYGVYPSLHSNCHHPMGFTHPCTQTATIQLFLRKSIWTLRALS